MNARQIGKEYFRLEGWGRTLGYWVIGVKDVTNVRIRSAKEMSLLLSAQYDAEGQASVGDDDVWGHPNFTPFMFSSLAPVQLARDWSPMPTACDLLGQPDSLDLCAEGTFPSLMAIWDSPVMGKSSDYPDKFSARLAELFQIYIRLKMPIGLAAVRGFSFDDEDKYLTDVAQSALVAAGFQILDRSPV